MARGVLLAGAEYRIEHQAQVADPEGVQHVARTPRLVRVVAHLGAFLVTVQRLDRGVHVQHPRPIQRIAHAAHQRITHPRFAGRAVHRLEPTAHRVFADHALKAQRLRSHRVAANAGNVRVAPAARQDAQHQRAQHVALPRGVGTAVVQGARRPSGQTRQQWPGTRRRTRSARAAWPAQSRPSARACARPSSGPPSRPRWLAPARSSSVRRLHPSGECARTPQTPAGADVAAPCVQSSAVLKIIFAQSTLVSNVSLPVYL